MNKTVAVTTAIALTVLTIFPSKKLMAETVMADSSFAARYPALAMLTGAAKQRAMAQAGKRDNTTYTDDNTNYTGFGAKEPMAAKRDDAAEAASNAINALYGQVNRYADLTPSERQKLGEDIAKNGDADLIAAYLDAKVKYSAAPDVQPAKAGKGEAEPAPVIPAKVENDAGAEPAPATPAVETLINGLYSSINKYADLTGAEQEALGKDVAATRDAGLIDAYNEAKAGYKPKANEEPAKPAVKEPPVEAEKKAVEPGPEAVAPAPVVMPPKPAAKKTEPSPTTVQKADADPVAKEAAQKDLDAIKGALNSVIDECYKSINAMSPETFSSDSAMIAGTMKEIKSIMDKSFPKGDNWVGYTWKNLLEYFVQSCEAMPAGKK